MTGLTAGERRGGRQRPPEPGTGSIPNSHPPAATALSRSCRARP